MLCWNRQHHEMFDLCIFTRRWHIKLPAVSNFTYVKSGISTVYQSEPPTPLENDIFPPLLRYTKMYTSCTLLPLFLPLSYLFLFCPCNFYFLFIFCLFFFFLHIFLSFLFPVSYISPPHTKKLADIPPQGGKLFSNIHTPALMGKY